MCFGMLVLCVVAIRRSKAGVRARPGLLRPELSALGSSTLSEKDASGSESRVHPSDG